MPQSSSPQVAHRLTHCYLLQPEGEQCALGLELDGQPVAAAHGQSVAGSQDQPASGSRSLPAAGRSTQTGTPAGAGAGGLSAAMGEATLPAGPSGAAELPPPAELLQAGELVAAAVNARLAAGRPGMEGREPFQPTYALGNLYRWECLMGSLVWELEAW